MRKEIIRYTHGFIFWPAHHRPYGQVNIAGGHVIRVRNVIRFDLDDNGHPIRLETERAIYVQVKE